MTEVRVSVHDGMIQRLSVSGHALGGEYGKDPVCAGISSIVVGALNGLDELFPDACALTMRSGYAEIQVKKFQDSLAICLEFLLRQLQTVEEAYPENIQIIRKEV